MFTQEKELLKAQEQFRQLKAFVRKAVEQGERIDQVERELLRQLLAIGRTCLQAFVAAQGDGDVGETTTSPAGESCQRLPEAHERRYVSIFGELAIERYVYGSREGQKIEAMPLDARLGLPAGDFSYVLEDWAQRLCVKEAFAEASGGLESLLGLRLSVRSLEHMNRDMAPVSEMFRLHQPPPAQAEEGPLLVVTADGKGVPMRRPLEERVRGHQRRGKGEKANKKQMAYVGAVYSIERFVRTADDVVDEWRRRKQAVERPQPQHKRVWAEMTQVIEDEECNGKVTLFGEMADEVEGRNPQERKEVVCLLDGERALWECQRESFPEAVGVLDIFHVLERLWLAAHNLHPEGSRAAEQFVTKRLHQLLQGEVGRLIGGLRRLRGKLRQGSQKRRTLEQVIVYLDNNREHMKYDEYLAAGYPIGSGVAEGACRHLVKDRLEQSGMRWTVDGAQSLLHLRAIHVNSDWDSFIAYRIEEEQTRLYGRLAA